MRRRELEFNVDDWVFLKFLSMKGVVKFRKKEKFSIRYIGPFQILRSTRIIAYELEI